MLGWALGRKLRSGACSRRREGTQQHKRRGIGALEFDGPCQGATATLALKNRQVSMAVSRVPARACGRGPSLYVMAAGAPLHGSQHPHVCRRSPTPMHAANYTA